MVNLHAIWYERHALRFALAPLSLIFCSLAKTRRLAYHYNLLKSHSISVPVIIVGNITVGGTGKTPLVIWLAQFLKQHGFQPAIVSRGYGGKSNNWPQQVRADSDPTVVGDEPVLLAKHSQCPVAVAPKRSLAIESLLKTYPCNIIISDDGLQHYALQRDIEIAVIDDILRYGNGYCLPAGPLREPISRLSEIDFLITKGAALQGEISMQYDMEDLHNLKYEHITQPLSNLRGKSVHAIAGIGHPERFFNRLRDKGLKVNGHAFPDHCKYTAKDIDFKDDLPVIMTEKDAVKCQYLVQGPKYQYLSIKARLPKFFGERLLERLEKIRN
jgi:tetraacyldisaccharide 4'-kinase